MPPRALPAMLYLGDALCLVAFVVIGMRGHETLAGAGALLRFAANAGPMLLAWTGAGLALGTFRLSPEPSLPGLLGRTLAAWLIAAPLALLLRASLLNSSVLVVIFVQITLALGAALLLAWRSLFFLAVRRARR